MVDAGLKAEPSPTPSAVLPPLVVPRLDLCERELPRHRASFLQRYPGLAGDVQFIFHSPRDLDYNCVGLAFGRRAIIVHHHIPADFPYKAWWNAEVPREPGIDHYIELFQRDGFLPRPGPHAAAQPGDVLLYADDHGLFSHAAVLLKVGLAHSKLGGSFNIYHAPGSIQGDLVGTIRCCLQPRASGQQLGAP